MSLISASMRSCILRLLCTAGLNQRTATEDSYKTFFQKEKIILLIQTTTLGKTHLMTAGGNLISDSNPKENSDINQVHLNYFRVRHYAIMKTLYLQKLVFNTFMNNQIIFKIF